jgi:hypothetical protein
MDDVKRQQSDSASSLPPYYRCALNLFAASVLFIFASNVGEQMGKAAYLLTH